MKTCNLQEGFVFEHSTHLNDSIAEVLIKATNFRSVHHHVVTVKLKETRQSGKGPKLPEHLRDLLTEVDYPLTVVYSEKNKQLFEESSPSKSEYQTKDLARLCRNVIRDCFIPNVLFGAKHLPLPQKLRYYIALDNIST